MLGLVDVEIKSAGFTNAKSSLTITWYLPSAPFLRHLSLDPIAEGIPVLNTHIRDCGEKTASKNIKYLVMNNSFRIDVKVGSSLWLM
jgi:hypothetical protein